MGNNYRKFAGLILAGVFVFACTEAVSATPHFERAKQIVQAGAAQRNPERELLGPYADIKSLTTSNLAHAYITFLENVKARNGNWSAQDWDGAKVVMQKLDARKNSMARILKVADVSHIKKVQAEFRKLEAQNHAKN